MLTIQLLSGAWSGATIDGYGRTAGVLMDAPYRIKYAYDVLGRCMSITATIYNVTSAVDYAYLPGSTLLVGHTICTTFGVALKVPAPMNPAGLSSLPSKTGPARRRSPLSPMKKMPSDGAYRTWIPLPPPITSTIMRAENWYWRL